MDEGKVKSIISEIDVYYFKHKQFPLVTFTNKSKCVLMLKVPMGKVVKLQVIDIPLQFIHLVPKGRTYESPLFGGIVVERTSDKAFAIKLFQKLFTRMSFSAVKIHRDRTLTFIDVGGNFKEAVASIFSRSFFDEVVLDNNLFKKDELINEKECFDFEAEKVFLKGFEEARRSSKGLIPKEKLFHDMVEATINGRIIPLMTLRDHKVGPEEVNDLLRWFNEVGTKLS